MDNYTSNQAPQPPQSQVQQPYQPYGSIPAPPTPQAPAAEQTRGSSRRSVIVAGITVIAVILGIAAFVVGGEPRKFMEVGIQFIPFAVLALIAYAGAKSSQAAFFAYVCLFLVEGLLLFNVFADVLLASIADFNKLQEWENNPVGIPMSEVFRPDTGPILLWTFLLLIPVTAIAFAMLFRSVRVAIARIIPIGPDNFVHKIALSLLSLMLLSSFIPLIVLSGHPPILEILNNPTFNSVISSDAGISIRPQDLIYQLVWMLPTTLVGAGWLVARKFPTVLERLGMVKPTLVQVVMALVVGVVFAFLGTYLDQGINWLFTSMGWPTTDAGTFGQLLKSVANPVGAVVLGVTAGVGEEMAVRGLLQPRIGLIASNLVFTSLHAFQYGLDGLLSVFIIGLILGIIRARTNTTTSAIVHGTYDFTIVMSMVNF